MFMDFVRCLFLDTTVGDAAGDTTTTTGGQSPWILIIYIVAIAALFYFMLYRPNKKKEKQKKNMLDNMKKGDRITTIGGIQGKISQIKDDSIIIDVASVAGTEKVKLEIQKWAIGSVDSQDDSAAD